MGYDIRRLPGRFFLPGGNKEAAALAFKQAVNEAIEEQCNHPDGDGRAYDNYWPLTSLRGILAAEDLDEILAMFRFTAEEDANKNLIGIYFQGFKYGSTPICMNILMPFTSDDTVVAFEGEDGTWFRWRHEGDQIVREIAVYNATDGSGAVWLPWPANVHPQDFVAPGQEEPALERPLDGPRV